MLLGRLGLVFGFAVMMQTAALGQSRPVQGDLR